VLHDADLVFSYRSPPGRIRDACHGGIGPNHAGTFALIFSNPESTWLSMNL
jgi:hypothetical protein